MSGLLRTREMVLNVLHDRTHSVLLLAIVVYMYPSRCAHCACFWCCPVGNVTCPLRCKRIPLPLQNGHAELPQ